MRKRKSNINKVFEALAADPSYPGKTASRIAAERKLSRKQVQHCVSDLREEGVVIYSNVAKPRNGGTRRVYYRMPA